MSSAPLEGLKIIDLTTVIMGPYATQVLADYGADVIKVETPQGDTTRQVPPMRHTSMGYMYLNLNRNKRSVVLDLKDPGGVTAMAALLNGADVFITNVRTAGLERLGLSYERFRESNPRLIWINLVGFGSDGPYVGRPAYDDLIQGLTAVPYMLVAAGSEHPHFVPLSFNDRAVGLQAAVALLAAVRGRETTGRGQAIEIPMYEFMAQFTVGDHTGGHTFEPPIGPAGYQRTLNPERRPYETQDGMIGVIVYTDNHWRSFFEITGQPERFELDPKVQTLVSRTTHAGELYREVGEAMRTRTTAEWLAAFTAADIPAAPVHTIDSALYDEHLQATGFVRVIDHPTEGKLRVMGVPSRWSDAELPEFRPAPSLGQHTREVLLAAGVAPDIADRMAALVPAEVHVPTGGA